jgi:hypothetical protein
MATPAPENIPDLTAAMLDLDLQVTYDQVVPIRDYAVHELYGSLYMRSVQHGEFISKCSGNITFPSLGDAGTASETPEMTYGMRAVHMSNPDGWLLSLSVKSMMSSHNGSRLLTLYRLGCFDRETRLAGKVIRGINASTEIRIVRGYPVEDETLERTFDIEPFTPEDSDKVLAIMKGVVRRSKVQSPKKLVTVRQTPRELDIDDFRL